jgi:hypothetical protein
MLVGDVRFWFVWNEGICGLGLVGLWLGFVL